MEAASQYLPHRRLLESGWESLSDVELLALFLSPGLSEARALQVAQTTLLAVNSTRELLRLPYGDLRKLGLTHRRAVSLQAALRLAKRANLRAICHGQSFRSSLEIFRYFGPRIQHLRKECFWNVLLDGKNRIQRVVRVSEGTLTASHVHPREVFRPAIREAAVGVLFVHNHPSGDPTPSQEDIQSTRRLKETGQILGIRVLDHVIIGDLRYFSFADEGLL
jgi:DNA repair protein RadC